MVPRKIVSPRQDFACREGPSDNTINFDVGYENMASGETGCTDSVSKMGGM